jgi:mutator protein MutT
MRRIEVAAGLVFHNGYLLITQRHEDDPLGGLWEFPGGKREAHETWQACLRRELREELGIEVEVGPLWESVDHTYPEQQVHLRFFLCRLVQHTPQAIGCQDFHWINRKALDQYPFPPADARLIQRLKASPDLWTRG